MAFEAHCKKSGAYWTWIRAEAARIGSDGCTHVTELGECCCLEHDLAYHFGRDPRHAFVISQVDPQDPWSLADRISFVETNNRFAGCLPWWLKYRWLGVMTAGYLIWQEKRKQIP